VSAAGLSYGVVRRPLQAITQQLEGLPNLPPPTATPPTPGQLDLEVAIDAQGRSLRPEHLQPWLAEAPWVCRSARGVCSASFSGWPRAKFP
jgi:hypothetical protein